MCLGNAPTQEPVYRKVAIVENFFDIIYTVHVELEGRPGKHAGQKRTYRTITETYAFLPREAVTRHPYLPFIPHCASDYSRNWESEIDAAHSNFPYEKFDYTELQPVKKADTPKPETEEPEPTYIELTSKKVNGFDAPTPVYSRNSPVEPPFREEEPVRTDPEIDKDENSLIDVEEVKNDSPVPIVPEDSKKEEESEKESTRTKEMAGVESKTEVKKYNPLDVANLTSKDPPKSKSPPRKKLLPTASEFPTTFGRFPRPWRPDGGLYYAGEEMDYSIPITTAYLKHMRSMTYQDRMDVDNKVSL
ncbi:hypothetical protein NE865_08245 [Phthorimaea operculella]|nr:hypothetical protein NE865_08245 [Phthorimaea operculella]